MNQFYDIAIAQLLEGELDFLMDPIALSAWADAWFNVTDSNVSELYGTQVAEPVALENVRVSGRTLEADPVTFAAIDESQSITALILQRADTGELIGYIDQRPDLAPIHVQGNGGPVTFTWGGTGGATVISL